MLIAIYSISYCFPHANKNRWYKPTMVVTNIFIFNWIFRWRYDIERVNDLNVFAWGWPPDQCKIVTTVVHVIYRIYYNPSSSSFFCRGGGRNYSPPFIADVYFIHVISRPISRRDLPQNSLGNCKERNDLFFSTRYSIIPPTLCRKSQMLSPSL